jgi:hypothetical protein
VPHMQLRYTQHPFPSLALRAAAASVYATAIRFCADTGRIEGHLSRGMPGCLCHRFDWFCGTLEGVVESEQRVSLLRLTAYLLGMAAMWHWVGI